MTTRQENTTLLRGHQVAPVSTRGRAVRWIVSVLGGAFLLASCLLAVASIDHAVNMRGASEQTTNMASQSIWDSLQNGFCSARAYGTCVFYSDPDLCRSQIHENCDASNSTDTNDTNKKIHHKKKKHTTAEPTTLPTEQTEAPAGSAPGP